jgi:hypothetical protein
LNGFSWKLDRLTVLFFTFPPRSTWLTNPITCQPWSNWPIVKCANWPILSLCRSVIYRLLQQNR